MVYIYAPTYYSQVQDTLTSVCKSILLPFSLKNRRLPADQKLAKKQSDNLKWQQESFHKILNLMGLQKEGIVPETEVSIFRSHLLETLSASPKEQELVGVIRDKLLFLQELFHAKCISADEYHSSKRPLLQRLAVQGVELDCRDVIIGSAATTTATTPEEGGGWSVIDLADKQSTPLAAEKTKHKTPPIKSLINKWRGGKDNKHKEKNAANNESTGPILIPESSSEKSERRKPFRSLFDKEEKDDEDSASATDKKKKKKKPVTPVKKQWGLDGLKKWRTDNTEEGEREENLNPNYVCLWDHHAMNG